jgi:hypothetical protein
VLTVLFGLFIYLFSGNYSHLGWEELGHVEERKGAEADGSRHHVHHCIATEDILTFFSFFKENPRGLQLGKFFLF